MHTLSLAGGLCILSSSRVSSSLFTHDGKAGALANRASRAKRREQRRQTAQQGQSNGPHHSDAATVPAHSATPVAQPKRERTPRTRERDRLTGEPLRRETPKLVIRDYHEFRPPDARQPLPLKLHVLQDETVDSHEKRLGQFAGGMRWSPAFGEYIGNEVSPQEAKLATNYHWQQWWKSDYLTRYVVARMGLETVRMLFALRLNGRNHAVTAALYGKSPQWLMRQEVRAWGLARQLVTNGVTRVRADTAQN